MFSFIHAAGIAGESGKLVGQTAYIKATNAAERDHFGSAVAVDGDLLVVGAPREATAAAGVNGDPGADGPSNLGAAYVYRLVAGTWIEEAYIKPPAGALEGQFGAAVGLSGNTIVIGSWEVSLPGGGAGRAYVYTIEGGTWQLEALLEPSQLQGGQRFGASVAISGDTIAIGADGERGASVGINGDQSDQSERNSGAVYVFERSAGAWQQTAYVKPSDNERSNYFGQSVALDGEIMVVGAPQGQRETIVLFAQFPIVAVGKAYIFERVSGVCENSRSSSPKIPVIRTCSG